MMFDEVTMNSNDNNNTISKPREAYSCTQLHPNIDPLKAAIVSNLHITLTPEEQCLFDTLEQTAIAYENHDLSLPIDSTISNSVQCQHLHNHNDYDYDSKRKRVEIRIAGGWVRDKLLNTSSHDVDIALDTLSGYEFALLVQSYLSTQQQQQDNNKTKNKSSKIGFIAANPDQSKHLETATMKINSIECDFVHLRGEIYSSHSRIPTLVTGSTVEPLHDAQRRDFTINALFYNLRSKSIEDWTGRGVHDLLHKKELHTPLDANITFQDDPLRVLRGVRMSVRYDLRWSDEMRIAAQSGTVQEALHVKVSRERVGKELEGMLTGKNAKPHLALKMITDLKLSGCVFSFPHELEYQSTTTSSSSSSLLSLPNITVSGVLEGVEYQTCQTMEERSHLRERGWIHATKLLDITNTFAQAFLNNNIHQEQSNISDAPTIGLDERILYLSSSLYPLRKLIITDEKNKQYPLTSYIVRESLKFKNKDVQAIAKVMDTIDEMVSFLYKYTNNHHSAMENDMDSDSTDNGTSNNMTIRLELGLLLRKSNELWVTTLLLAGICLLHQTHQSHMNNNILEQNILKKTLKLYHDIIHHYKLDYCWKMKPLIHGKALLEPPLNIPNGPTIGIYIEEQIRWMLLNPNGSISDCKDYLLTVRKREMDQGNGTSCKKAHIEEGE